MNVRDFMKTQVVTVSASTSASEAWKLLFHKHVHDLPVVDKDKKLLGIIVKEDFLMKLFPDFGEALGDSHFTDDASDEIKERLDKLKKMSIEKLMNKNVIFTRADTNVMRALSRMLVRKVRQLPVLDDDDQLIGMVSKGDVFDGMFRKKRRIRK